uniref:Tetratricopeptide repeat protein n=1 Tax=Schlesneria paludicola TaxID=360056 RepID=A0A7C2NYB2_9PLAN
MRSAPTTALLTCGFAILWALAGCATHLDRLQPVRDSFFAGNVDQARTLVEQAEKKRGDRDVLKLDRAMIELASGRPKEAERLLREARDRFDHLEQKSLAEDAASLAADDTLRSYAGEDYEKVLIRVMLALSNLMADGGDASAYALQITEKQEQIAQRLETKDIDAQLRMQAYKQIALGPYIRAMIAEESPLTLDDAVRARVQVASFAPEFRDGKSDLQRAQHEVPIPPGHGVLYVFALVGRGPVKEEVHEVATQAALLVADRIVSANANRGLPPTLAPVPIPKVVTFSPAVQSIGVQVDGAAVGRTATIVDIGHMASLQQEARYPEILGRAVARRVLKKGAIYAVKEGVDAEPWSPESIALNLVGIAWEATERADLRCWGLLPDQIQVLRVTLPAGEHDIALQPDIARQSDGRSMPLGPVAQTRVRIHDGRNAYLLGCFPDWQLVGQLLTSGGE